MSETSDSTSGVGSKIELAAAAPVGTPHPTGVAAALVPVLESLRPVVVHCVRAEFAAVLGRTEADAIALEVCDALLRKLCRPDHDGKPVLAVMHNEIRRRTQAVRAHRKIEASDPVSRMLAGLPEDQRDVLVLRIVGGLSVEESARAMGITQGKVRMHQHRAMTTLRQHPVGAN